MIDWRIAKIASSGMRGMRLRLRHVMTSPSRDGLADAARAARRRRLASRVVAVMRRSPTRRRRVAGEGEEDVVERRAAQADVVDGDAGLVEVADDLDEARGAAVRRAPSGVRVCSSTVASPSASRARTSIARAMSLAVVDDHLDALAADLRP